jgi:hypothetical protein
MRRVAAVLMVVVLVVVVLVSGLTVFAQVQGPRGRQSGPTQILSGSDIGFRVEGADPRTGNPTGTWMIRMNGDWVEVGAIPSMKLAR